MSINELQILLDLNQDNKTKILKNVASMVSFGYFFVDSEAGHCYLFDENGNIDDINKIKTIKEPYIKKDIKKIVIPDSVEIIETWAFFDCVHLISIDIPNSVKKIKSWAFRYCKNLKSINIPDSVKHIGNAAFSQCKNLTSIRIPNSIKIIGNTMFEYCKNLTSINIPNSVESIDYSAFKYCDSLTSIEIPDSVKHIEKYAFYKCENLKSIIFKNKTIDQVKSMDNYPFGIEDKSIIKYI